MATNVGHDKPERSDEPDAKKPKVIEAQAQAMRERMSDDDGSASAEEINETSEQVKKLRLPAEDAMDVAVPGTAGDSTAGSTSAGSEEAEAEAEDAPATATPVPVPVPTPTEKPATASGFGGFSAFKGGFSGFASFANASKSTGFGAFASASGESPTTFATKAKTEDEDGEDPVKVAGPVVTPLTEAELANGEEEELILVEKRAKMYKLVDNDYAEVGIGPLRVLQPKDTTDPSELKARARIVMRRESYPRGPGTKLILNTRLSACVSCMRKAEKALLLVVVERDETLEGDEADEEQPNKTKAPEVGAEAVLKPATYLLRFGESEDLPPVQASIHALLPNASTTSSTTS